MANHATLQEQLDVEEQVRVAQPLFEITFFGALAVILVVPGAMRSYENLAAGPWWQIPRTQRVRYLAKQAPYLFAGAAVLAICFVIFLGNHPTSFLDAINLWLGCLMFGIVVSIPSWLLGTAWNAITHRRHSRPTSQDFPQRGQ